MQGYVLQLAPTVPRLRRCFKCQIFGYTVNLCRSTYPASEFCAGRHLTTYCFNRNNQSKYRNCKGRHAVSSSQCPVYIYKFNILKLRYSTGCSKEEAKIIVGNGNAEALDGSLSGSCNVSVVTLGSEYVRASSSSLIKDDIDPASVVNVHLGAGIKFLAEISDFVGATNFLRSFRLEPGALPRDGPQPMEQTYGKNRDIFCKNYFLNML